MSPLPIPAPDDPPVNQGLVEPAMGRVWLVDLPDEQPYPGENDPGEDEHDSLIDRMRGTGVGVEDPNIIGDAGPTDVVPGADPDPMTTE